MAGEGEQEGKIDTGMKVFERGRFRRNEQDSKKGFRMEFKVVNKGNE